MLHKFMPPVTTPAQIKTWIEGARRGDSLTYHYGYLPADGNMNTDAGRQVAANGAAAWHAYDNGNGNVTLVQHKIGEHLYQYRMQRL